MTSVVLLRFTAILRQADRNFQRNFFPLLQAEFDFPIAYFAHALMLAGSDHLAASMLALTTDGGLRLAQIKRAAFRRGAPVVLFAFAAVDTWSDGLTYAVRTTHRRLLQAIVDGCAFTRFLVESDIAGEARALVLAWADVLAGGVPTTRRRRLLAIGDGDAYSSMEVGTMPRRTEARALSGASHLAQRERMAGGIEGLIQAVVDG